MTLRSSVNEKTNEEINTEKNCAVSFTALPHPAAITEMANTF